MQMERLQKNACCGCHCYTALPATSSLLGFLLRDPDFVHYKWAQPQRLIHGNSIPLSQWLFKGWECAQ